MSHEEGCRERSIDRSRPIHVFDLFFDLHNASVLLVKRVDTLRRWKLPSVHGIALVSLTPGVAASTMFIQRWNTGHEICEQVV